MFCIVRCGVSIKKNREHSRQVIRLDIDPFILLEIQLHARLSIKAIRHENKNPDDYCNLLQSLGILWLQESIDFILNLCFMKLLFRAEGRKCFRWNDFIRSKMIFCRNFHAFLIY